MTSHSAILLLLLIIAALTFSNEKWVCKDHSSLNFFEGKVGFQSTVKRKSIRVNHSDIEVLDTKPFGKVNICNTISRNI